MGPKTHFTSSPYFDARQRLKWQKIPLNRSVLTRVRNKWSHSSEPQLAQPHAAPKKFDQQSATVFNIFGEEVRLSKSKLHRTTSELASAPGFGSSQMFRRTNSDLGRQQENGARLSIKPASHATEKRSYEDVGAVHAFVSTRRDQYYKTFLTPLASTELLLLLGHLVFIGEWRPVWKDGLIIFP